MRCAQAVQHADNCNWLSLSEAAFVRSKHSCGVPSCSIDGISCPVMQTGIIAHEIQRTACIDLAVTAALGREPMHSGLACTLVRTRLLQASFILNGMRMTRPYSGANPDPAMQQVRGWYL